MRQPLLALSCAVMAATPLVAAPAGAVLPPPGSLDPTFGTGGATVDDLDAGGWGFDTVNDAVVQPDGRIVVTGTFGDDWDRSVLVGRYRSDGSLDPTFGEGGLVDTAVRSDDPSDWQDGDVATAVALQADGKVVVVGSTRDVNDLGDPEGTLVARFLPDGRLDPAFDGDGIVVTEMFGGANAVTVLPDGRILVAGGANGNVFLARYLADGRLDATHGTGGIAVADTGAASGATGLVVQPNGRVVVSATAYARAGSPAESDVALVRFLRTGALDPSFGTGGVVTTDLGSPNDMATSVGLGPDGRIVVAGWSGPAWNQRDFAVARYRRNGTLDRSFGAGGVVRTTFAEVPGRADDGAMDLLVQRDGRILVTGSVGQTEDRWCGCAGEHSDIGLVRYRRDGSLDPTFGTGGRVVTDLGRVEVPVAVEASPGNRVVVAGIAPPPTSQANDNFVARYLIGPGL